LKPEPGLRPKSQAQSRLEPDLGLKAKLLREFDMRNCGEQKTCVSVVAGTQFITLKIATTLTETLALSGTNVAC